MLTALIRGGEVYDGLGNGPQQLDIGIAGDRIACTGDLSGERASDTIDAQGLSVAPGFVNPLSWATESLLVDGAAESDVRQGVTLEVFGEGSSMGPLNASMRDDLLARHGAQRFDVPWTTLGEYLAHLESRGVAVNVASFVGAATVRVHELGYTARAPAAAELERMCALVRGAMREGALGVGSALIYTPGSYASTEELTALARAAAKYAGGYSTHLRSETARIGEALEEALAIAAAAGTHLEIHHLKAAGRANWHRLDEVLATIERARERGQSVSANVYPYTAAASGFDAAMPPWVQEGGYEAWFRRLREPDIRSRVLAEIAHPGNDWENLYAAAGSAERVVLNGFRTEALRRYVGRTLADVARERGRSPEETMIDLVLEDGSRLTVAYELASEENLCRQLERPWVSICSDEEALAPRAPFLARRPHPRAYGAFARFLGHYVRERKVTTLAEAVRRLTSLPADNFRLRGYGRIAPGCFADLVLFEPDRMADHATYEEPHRFASGVKHVMVNGRWVLLDGAVTGVRPGRFVRGPGVGSPRRSLES